MFGSRPSDYPQKLGFILTDQFSMMAFASAVETLRMANRLSDKQLYDWVLVSDTGHGVACSNGITVPVDGPLETALDCVSVTICSGLDVHKVDTALVIPFLRKAASKGLEIGAICTGAFILAKSGLLDGHTCTIHWENLAAFTELFPNIEVTTEVFEIDRKRYSCSGGTAALDLMLNLVAIQHGHELAAAVADQLLHERIRDHRDQQRVALPARLGVRHPKLLAAIKAMEENLEEPLTRSELAEMACLSTRQLERLFRKYMNRSPARYYLELRLNKSRLLLLQTPMPVIDVALACGFVSASHFSKCYRDFFGKTPRQERSGTVDAGDLGFHDDDETNYEEEAAYEDEAA
ncbi:GlxA family transcriptional regulator [Alphaproteobacteria bacterium]|jgi:AraC family transcriptional regulator, glycine betaine-responsive activator|nr:GlxA family transcriptional regulator [Alphaproteobacteria bacterium]